MTLIKRKSHCLHPSIAWLKSRRVLDFIKGQAATGCTWKDKANSLSERVSIWKYHGVWWLQHGPAASAGEVAPKEKEDRERNRIPFVSFAVRKAAFSLKLWEFLLGITSCLLRLLNVWILRQTDVNQKQIPCLCFGMTMWDKSISLYGT